MFNFSLAVCSYKTKGSFPPPNTIYWYLMSDSQFLAYSYLPLINTHLFLWLTSQYLKLCIIIRLSSGQYFVTSIFIVWLVSPILICSIKWLSSSHFWLSQSHLLYDLFPLHWCAVTFDFHPDDTFTSKMPLESLSFNLLHFIVFRKHIGQNENVSNKKC